MRRLALVFAVVLAFSTTAMAVDIAISTQAGWWSQGAADTEMQEIADNVTGASVEQFPADQQDALATWVADHTGDGVEDLLILCGTLPDTIYTPGNSQADDSLAELFLDDGNTIINTGDWIFYVVNGAGTNGPGGLQTIMDIPGVTVTGEDNTAVTVTADGQEYTPSLEDLQTDRPFHLDTLDGDWYVELILAQNAAGTRADPVIVRNSATGGRIGIFYQTNGQDGDPRGEVISEWINNWYLKNVSNPALPGTPNPASGAIDVPRDVVLGWESGEFAATHDVYFGTVFEDVNGASRADSMGVLASQGQTGASFAPDSLLEFSQTYYWRIDEVNSAPDNTIFKGDVWSFTVEPLAYPIAGVLASSNGISDAGVGPERTVDGSGLDEQDEHSIDAPDMWVALPDGVDPLYVQYEFDQVYKLHEMRVWNYNVMFEMVLGFGLKDVTVEYSTDGAEWTVLGDVEFARATSAVGYTANTIVAFDGVAAKYVRLTVNSGWGSMPVPQFGLSEVRFMQIPAQARESQPADGDTGVMADAALSWRAGREAVSHDVYLSTDKAAVADGTALVDTVTVTSYTPGDLEFGATYYWKIDEVNEADAVSVWEGAIWRFSTQEYAVIDDMESYTDDTDAGEAIWQNWIDGYEIDGNGSQVGYIEAPFAEGTIVNSGSQSMPLYYNNTGAATISEAVKELGGMNLAGNGADSLRLFVSGVAPSFYEGADGTILMNGIGDDIWNAADQFRFAYKQLTGDGSMIARVDALDGSPSTWAKAGVMIRQGSDGGAVNAFIAMTGGDGGGATFQQRLEADGASVSEHTYAGGPFAPPYWIQLTRTGNEFSAFISPDGETWTQAAQTVTVEMADPVQIGLALTSHNANQATGAAFSNISITGASGAWELAEIGVAQPTTGNDPQPIYVALDGSVVVHPDAGVTGKAGWTEWVIPLSEFGGNLSNVQSITVGVGNPNNGSAGSGLVFIDDIGYGRPAPAVEGVSILINGGFEDGVVEPWLSYSGDAIEVVQQLTGAVVPEGSIEGQHCLHVVIPTAGANSWDNGMKQPNLVFEAGKKYTFSAFLKCKEGTLDIRFKPELDADPYTAYGEQVFTMTEEWAEYSMTTPVMAATVSPTAATFHMGFAAGEFWIDNVRLYEGDYVAP